MTGLAEPEHRSLCAAVAGATDRSTSQSLPLLVQVIFFFFPPRKPQALFSDWLKHFTQTESFTLCQRLARPATLCHASSGEVSIGHSWGILAGSSLSFQTELMSFLTPFAAGHKQSILHIHRPWTPALGLKYGKVFAFLFWVPINLKKFKTMKMQDRRSGVVTHYKSLIWKKINNLISHPPVTFFIFFLQFFP